MVPDIASLKTDPDELVLAWSRGWSLTARILAVNIFVLALFAGGLFFLDSYRERLIEERQLYAARNVALISESLNLIQTTDLPQYLVNSGILNKSRIRLYDASGAKILDSFILAKPTYEMRDPENEPWEKKAARSLDKAFDFLVQAQPLESYSEPAADTAAAWPETKVKQNGRITSNVRLAPDLTYFVAAGAWSPDGRFAILSTSSARDIRASVRAERFRIGMFFFFVLAIGIIMSLFLARTIVKPLKYLARAAVKVRLGRAQEVTIPRLPTRRDEIGMLARALSDMSHALRQRIDATEAFAADVAHEIKNPLASLRSALDGLDNIKDPALRGELMDVAKDDVRRMDRLISDISEASRVDSQLAKAKFELIDMGDMIEQLLLARESRDHDGSVQIAFARPRKGVAIVLGEDVRLERVLNNLIDNAVSFSPPSGLIEISATCTDKEVIIRISDEGPGVPPQEREAIFRRFHTERPPSESFGKHSGLGLAIARTIIEGHDGNINVHDREDGKQGACFEIAIPSPEAKLAE
jgi:two-component system, OmpR family, sensor histidine kinase ChvG